MRSVRTKKQIGPRIVAAQRVPALRSRCGVDAMGARQRLDAIAAAPRARACLVLTCCLIRCCPMGSSWSPSGRAARRGHDRQRSHRTRWATTSRAFAGRRRWTRLVDAHIDSAPPRLDSDNQAAVDVFYCDVVSVNAILAELRSPCSKNEKNPLQKAQLPSLCPLLLQPQFVLRRRVNSLHSWNSSLDAIASERVHQYDQCASFAAVQLFAVSALISYARGSRASPGIVNATLVHKYRCASTLRYLAPISVREASRGRHDSQKHLQRPRTHASVDAGSMAPKKRKGAKRPVGMLAPETKKEIDSKIEYQCKALLAQQSEPTKLLPRDHPRFFASIDATNVDDESLLSISLEDLPSDRVFLKDGGRGTNRKAVQLYLRDRLARAGRSDDADAKEVKRAKLREDGELDLEFADLDDLGRKVKWREALVDPASPTLKIPRDEFVERAGGKGKKFWEALSKERSATKVAKAKELGELWVSTRERTYTAS